MSAPIIDGRGLLEAELCFRLTADGRAQLTEKPEPRSFAVMKDDWVLCVDCTHEAAREERGAQSMVHAWIDAGPGVCCAWCAATEEADDGERAER